MKEIPTLQHRTLRSVAVGSTCAAFAVSLLLMPSAANAATTHDSAGPVKFKTTISDAYKKSREDKSFGADMRQKFVQDQASKGHYYAADSIDYLRVERTDGEAVEVVTPKTFKIERAKLVTKAERNAAGNLQDHVVASVEGGEDEAFDTSLGYPSGPGFAFGSVNNGTYWLYTSRGNMESNWWKQKDMNDTNAYNDYWSYARKAKATPYDISGWDDTIYQMGTRTYPSSSTRNILTGWVDYSPAQSSWHGDCSGAVSLTAYGVVGYSFQSCEDYRMDRNSNWQDAGDMSINWANGIYWTESGPQEMAFIFVVTSQQGTQPYYKDYQYVDFQAGGIGASYRTAYCASTDSNAWC